MQNQGERGGVDEVVSAMVNQEDGGDMDPRGSDQDGGVLWGGYLYPMLYIGLRQCFWVVC